jgi:integrase/recombinase XerD
VRAGAASGAELVDGDQHALISLLALNGLRVSEATGADIEALGMERGHRTLVITRKGGKVVTIPLAPRTARAIDLAIGERCEGPIFLAPGGRRLDRHGAARIVRRITRRAGIAKPVGPHTLRHAFITGVSTPASRSATSRKPPPTPTRERPCAMTGPGLHWTGMPHTSSPPMSQVRRARPGKPRLLRLADSQPARRSA